MVVFAIVLHIIFLKIMFTSALHTCTYWVNEGGSQLETMVEDYIGLGGVSYSRLVQTLNLCFAIYYEINMSQNFTIILLFCVHVCLSCIKMMINWEPFLRELAWNSTLISLLAMKLLLWLHTFVSCCLDVWFVSCHV